MRTTTTLLAVFVLLIAPLGTVAGQSDASSAPEVEVTDDRASIKVERTVDDRTVESEITFKTNDTAFDVRVDVSNTTETATSRLSAQLHQLVEFVDEDGDGRYSENDTVVSSYRVSDEADQRVEGPENGTITWKPLNTTDVQSDDGTPGKLIKARGTFRANDDPLADVRPLLDMEGNATFGLNLWVFGEATTLNGTELEPTEVKVDLLLHEYPYAREDSQIALVLDTHAEREVAEDGTTGAATSHALDVFTLDLLFAWDDQAQVDEQETSVETTRLDQDDGSEDTQAETAGVERSYALTYERGQQIVHDPRVGVTLASLDTTRTLGDELDSVPGMAAWVALSAFGAAAGLVHRHRD